MSAVEFAASSINLNSGTRAQTITVRAADSGGKAQPSGVAQVHVELTGKRYYRSLNLTLTSGTAASGQWSGSFRLSKYAYPGTYSIDDIDVVDAARNRQDYPGYGSVPNGPNALSLHPSDDPTFTVTGTRATPPPRKPAGTLSAFTLHPARVNTKAYARHVRVTAKFAGPAPRGVYVNVDSVRKTRQERFVFLDARLRRHHGAWSGTLRVPRWIGDQHLQVGLFASYSDHYRPGYRSYDSDQLRRRHFASRVVVTSRVDHSKPRLTALSVSPNPIDTTSGPQRITVTAHASDTGSGVRYLSVDGYIRHGDNGVEDGDYPYASAGIGYESSRDFHVRLHKTSNAVWTGTTKIRRCVPSGTYKLSADLSDGADNYRYYSSKRLASAGLPGTVDVTSEHGDVAPPYVYSAATYGPDHELFLNFSEGVTNIDTDTLSVFALLPRNTRYQHTARISSIVCSNGTTTVDCSGADGLATSAILTVPHLKPGKKYEIYANLDQTTPQLADGNRNPMDWNYGASEVIDA